jgi:hypothetical protein
MQTVLGTLNSSTSDVPDRPSLLQLIESLYMTEQLNDMKQRAVNYL